MNLSFTLTLKLHLSVLHQKNEKPIVNKLLQERSKKTAYLTQA